MNFLLMKIFFNTAGFSKLTFFYHIVKKNLRDDDDWMLFVFEAYVRILIIIYKV